MGESPITVSHTKWCANPQEVWQDLTSRGLASGLLVYPTSTVWGLGALPDAAASVHRLQELKNRDRPFLLVWKNDTDLLTAIPSAPKSVRDFVAKWAYHPVTVLLDIAWFVNCTWIPACCVSENGQVAVRVDGLRELGHLISASGARAWLSTSANIPGEAPAITAEAAQVFWKQLPIPRVFFAYHRPLLGKPSTLVDVAAQKILRVGACSVSFV